jgi:hypothetical protein
MNSVNSYREKKPATSYSVTESPQTFALGKKEIFNCFVPRGVRRHALVVSSLVPYYGRQITRTYLKIAALAETAFAQLRGTEEKRT